MEKLCKTCKWWKEPKDFPIECSPYCQNKRIYEYIRANVMVVVMVVEFENIIFKPSEDFGCVLWEEKDG